MGRGDTIEVEVTRPSFLVVAKSIDAWVGCDEGVAQLSLDINMAKRMSGTTSAGPAPARPIMGGSAASSALPKSKSVPATPTYSLKADNLLTKAKALEKSGKTPAAMKVYRQILDEYPNSQQAQTVKAHLKFLEDK